MWQNFWNPSRYKRKMKGLKKISWWLKIVEYKDNTMSTRSGGEIFFPPAPHTPSKKEKETLCSILFTLKVPNGYRSNPRSHISMDKLKFYSTEEHDFHVLMQQHLLVELCHVFPKVMWNTICRLFFIDRKICAKT
jgi:hypothetical protein